MLLLYSINGTVTIGYIVKPIYVRVCMRDYVRKNVWEYGRKIFLIKERRKLLIRMATFKAIICLFFQFSFIEQNIANKLFVQRKYFITCYICMFTFIQ